MAIPTKSTQTSELQYDPWKDINDDGKLDILDIVQISSQYGAAGTPINKTALLLELQSKIDSLNTSVLDLEAYFSMKLQDLNATAVQLQFQTAELEIQLAVLNATKLGKPDFDSGWTPKAIGITTFTHNLGTTNLIVYLVGRQTPSLGINNLGYGGDQTSAVYEGLYYRDLTESSIKVVRCNQDGAWAEIRVMLWRIPQS
jgi:hypothetical protein